MYSHAEWQNGKVLQKVQHKRCDGGERMNKPKTWREKDRTEVLQDLQSAREMVLNKDEEPRIVITRSEYNKLKQRIQNRGTPEEIKIRPKLEVIIPKEMMAQLTERITALKDEDNIKIRKLLSKASKKFTAEALTYYMLSTPLTREVFAGFYSVRRIK